MCDVWAVIGGSIAGIGTQDDGSALPVAVVTLIPFPGEIGEVIELSVAGATTNRPLDAPFFVVGDVCNFPPFAYEFRVVEVDDEHQRVSFERIS